MAVVGEVSSIQLPNGDEYEILDKDAALAKTPTDISATEETFMYQKSSGESCKYLTSIKGNSIVWNQLAPLYSVQSYYFGWSIENCNFTISNDGRQVNITFTSATNMRYRLYAPTISGHKYYCGYMVKASAGALTPAWSTNSGILPSLYGNGVLTADTWTHIGSIYSCGISGNMSVVYPSTSISLDGETISIKDYIITDLTLLGLDDITVAEIEAWLAHSGCSLPFPYTPGILRNNSALAIETTMFNQWDEEWEQGRINYTTGVNQPYASGIRSKNYIEAIPGSQYYVKYGLGGALFILEYDSEKNYLGVYTNAANNIVTIGSNTRYIRFYTTSGTQYLNDICINLSDPERNGTYEPHKTHKAKTGCDKIEVKSPNIWDEEWEEGIYNPNTGAKEPASAPGCIRCKNFIRVSPATTYYINKTGSGNVYAVFFYDINKNFISSITSVPSIFTTPNACAFVTFRNYAYYGLIYNNDICINLSGWANGRYFPHGILTFDDDMRSAGSAYNEKTRDKYYRRVNGVDLGTLTYTKETISSGTLTMFSGFPNPNSSGVNGANTNVVCSKYAAAPSTAGGTLVDKSCYLRGNGMIAIIDNTYADYSASAFATAMNGVTLYYELAVEEVYELANPTEMWVFADKDGTERIIYPESTTPYAPFCCDSFYATISAEAINDSLNLVEDRMMSGPAESTDGHVVVFNGEYGKSVKDSGLTIATSVPSGAVFTDTHRSIKVNSTQLLGNNATPVNFTAAGSATVVGEGDTITIASPPNRTAASGGTDTSVVTTGEKYTWNSKATTSDISQAVASRALYSDTVTAVSYDTTNKKITRTKNTGTSASTEDVVTAAKIVTDGGGLTSHKYRGIQVNGQVKLSDTDATYLEFKGGGMVDVTYDDADGLIISGPSKVTSVSSSSTDNQVPTAKCLYTMVGDIESLLAALR